MINDLTCRKKTPQINPRLTQVLIPAYSRKFFAWRNRLISDHRTWLDDNTWWWYIIYDDAMHWCIVGRWVKLCIKLPLRWCTRQSWCSQHFTHDPIRQPTPQPLMQPTLYTWSYIASVAYITTDYFKLHSCPTKRSLYCLNVLETWRQRFLDETEEGNF